MGDTAFDLMTTDLMYAGARAQRRNSITLSEYLEWRRAFTFDGIRGQRYGESFCNWFGIVDYVLLYKPNWESADQHIIDLYLENT